MDGRPAGVGGTYLPEGTPTSSPLEPGEPYLLKWDASTKTYTRADAPSVVDCTTEKGTVKDGYETVFSTTLTFTPATGGRPPGLSGTYSKKASPTPAGAAGGCTPFEETGAVVGTPTGALRGKAIPGLAGEYTVTATTDAPGSSDGSHGATALAVRTMKIAGSGPDYTIQGFVDVMTPLTRQGDAWNGESPPAPVQCDATPPIPGGYSAVESFTSLQPVALTADGRPVLAGRSKVVYTVTPAGAAANCQAHTANEVILMVPTSTIAAQPAPTDGG